MNKALSGLGRLLGCNLELDSEGGVALLFAEDITCAIEVPEGSSFAFLYIRVCQVPEKERDFFFESALSRNFFTFSLPGLFLSLDKNKNEFFLCCTVHKESLDVLTLESVLSSMIEEVINLRVFFLKKK